MENNTLTSLENKNRFVVTQANELIEADYLQSLTARAHKTARLILSLINPNDGNANSYTITIKALQQYLGLNSNTKWGEFYNEVKNIQDTLNKKSIEIRKTDGGYIRSPLMIIETTPKKGTITFYIPEPLKPYLLELKKNYTSYLLINIPKLRSSYSIRLYELLHQYRKFGKRSFQVDDLQKKVGSSYSAYGDFKRYVILKAQKDLKKHTDLAFAFHEKKTGRKITSIEFIVFGNKPKQQNPNQLSFLKDAIQADSEQEKPALPETIITAMNELGISEQNIAKYLAVGFEIIESKKKREEVIKRCESLQNYYLEKLELTKQSANSENAAGYFIKALKEDWVHSNSLKKSKAQTAAKERTKATKTLQTLTTKIGNLSKQKEAARKPIIQELLADDGDLETAYNIAMEGLGNFVKGQISDVLHLPIRKQYEESIHVSSRVGVYLVKTYPERFKKMDAIGKQIEQAQKEIQEIKQKYPSIK